MRQEVTIHSQLNHPSILKLYTFFEDGDFVYLVLELCTRGELHKYIKSLGRVLSEDEGLLLHSFIIHFILTAIARIVYNVLLNCGYHSPQLASFFGKWWEVCYTFTPSPSCIATLLSPTSFWMHPERLRLQTLVWPPS